MALSRSACRHWVCHLGNPLLFWTIGRITVTRFRDTVAAPIDALAVPSDTASLARSGVVFVGMAALERPRRAALVVRRSNLSTTDTVSAGTLRPMLRLALPVLAEQLLIMLVVYSDALLTGHYFGEAELAAINLLNYAMWFLTSLWLLISIGSTALVARFVGAGDWDLAQRVTNQSYVVGVALAAVEC